MEGKLIIFCAPSGSGKTSIVKQLLPRIPQLRFSVSACSREPRQGETDGKDYYFLSVETFRKRIEKNAFIEFEEVYPGSYYGTLASEVERIWAEGNHVVFDVDVIGGLNIKEKFANRALSIFIQPPSVEELKKRLTGRGTETPESLKKRLDKAEYELDFAPRFDEIVVNDDLDKAVDDTYHIVTGFLEKR